jgi:hypothetical protein
MKLMNGENTGPINIGNPGKTPLHLCHSLAALDNLISDLFVILYLHFCGNELDFLFSPNVGEFTMLELAENVKEVSWIFYTHPIQLYRVVAFCLAATHVNYGWYTNQCLVLLHS